MASTGWLAIRVRLLSGRDLELEHPPGRLMIAAPAHTLAELAEAIDVAFARWDHSHLHQFDFGERRRYMPGGSEFQPEVLDSMRETLGALGLTPGTEFEYVFDLGDDWRHSCQIDAVDVDPENAYGVQPTLPVPIWGWGWIPDQYGRVTEQEDE